MLNWKIGDVTVTRVVEMDTPMPYIGERSFLPDAKPERLREIPWLFPNFVSPEGALLLSIHALLVEAPGMKLVVDTCVGNDRPRTFLENRPLQTPFLQHITEAGFGRNEVDAVLCTHLHVDHVGWNTMRENDKWVPTFPRARYLFGRKEYEHATTLTRAESREILADSIKPIFDAGLAEIVETDYRISPELRLIPTPGHTPGHVSVVIESQDETAIITGDMIHHPCQIVHPEWASRIDTDKTDSTATRHARLAEWADKPVLVIGTHFAAPTAGHIIRDGDSYRFKV